MRYATDRSTVLAHPVELLSGPVSTASSNQVSDVSELLWHILHLQQHDELNIVMTSGDAPSTSERSGNTGHRGYLMDIELGAVCTVCVKRTF